MKWVCELSVVTGSMRLTTVSIARGLAGVPWFVGMEFGARH